MTIKFGDILYIDTPYRPNPESFCRSKERNGNRYKAGLWYSCRDLFHSILYNLKLFFFSHKLGKGHCIAAFMKKVEEKLDVQPRSEFGPTQRKTIMWVKPSKWWTSKAMRRSLFTILLRCGDAYIPNKDNFEKALFSNQYAKETKTAVNRFLAGYTEYTGKKRGWYNQFKFDEIEFFGKGSITEEEINKLLVKS